MNRLVFMDGLRGIAILLVVFYHSFSRWPDLVPYGYHYTNFPLFKFGWFGVELFFLISGFVILMTLEKSRNFADFIKRRWLRLFPAMLVATVIVFASAPFFRERPAGIPAFRDIIPGLLFIDPEWIGKTFNGRQGVLEGAFWSLFVEVKFYIVFGSLYFLYGKKRAKLGLFLCFFIGAIASFMDKKSLFSTVHNIDYYVNTLFSFYYFGWFALGAISYDMFKEKNGRKFFLAIVIGAIISFRMAMDSSSISIFIVAMLITVFFLSSLFSKTLQKILANKYFVFFGFISYPLYLIHENLMVSLIIKSGKITSYIPGILLPVIPIAIVSLIALLIAKYAEPSIKKLLLAFFPMKVKSPPPMSSLK